MLTKVLRVSITAPELTCFNHRPRMEARPANLVRRHKVDELPAATHVPRLITVRLCSTSCGDFDSETRTRLLKLGRLTDAPCYNNALQILYNCNALKSIHSAYDGTTMSIRTDESWQHASAMGSLLERTNRRAPPIRSKHTACVSRVPLDPCGLVAIVALS